MRDPSIILDISRRYKVRIILVYIMIVIPLESINHIILVLVSLIIILVHFVPLIVLVIIILNLFSQVILVILITILVSVIIWSMVSHLIHIHLIFWIKAIDWNIYESITNKRRVMSHIQSFHLCLFSFEIYKSITFMPPMILSSYILPWKFPMINRTAVSKLLHYVVCCNFKINVMHIYFKDFLTFIVKRRFGLNSRLNSWLIGR